MKRYFLAGCLILTAVFTGCAHYYRVVIDSINSGTPAQNKSFIVVPGNTGSDSNDLQFQEYARYTEKILIQSGYARAENNQFPDIEVYLSYGMGEPEQHVYSYTEPVWGQTGEQTNTYTSTHNTDNGTVSATITTSEPEYGVTGYTTQTGVITVYKKYIILDAYDMKTKESNNKLRHLWKTTISCTGKSTKLRKVFPVMIAASAPFIASNTSEEKEVDMSEESDVVKTLKGN
jgi:hypothetical protein